MAAVSQAHVHIEGRGHPGTNNNSDYLVADLHSMVARIDKLTTNSKMVPRGLEPRTLRLLPVRSNQLSYETCACYIKHG